MENPPQTVFELSSTQNVSELDVSDLSTAVRDVEALCTMITTETKRSTGADELCRPKVKISVVPLMQDAMKKFKDHVNSVLNKTLDEDVSLQEFQEKMEMLKTIVKCLLEENEVLLSSLAEVGSEAEKRVDLMEKRLQESAQTTRDTVYKICDWGEGLQDLVAQKCLAEQALYAMERHVERVLAENHHLRSQNANFCHDIKSLLSIISQARTTGHWEMDCVTFCEISPEDVYGPVCRMSSYQNSEPSKSVTIDDPAPDSSATTLESEGNSAMNGIGNKSETGFPFSSPAIKSKAPRHYQCHTWPGVSAGTSDDSPPFWMSHYLTPEDPEASPAFVPRTSSHVRYMSPDDLEASRTFVPKTSSYVRTPASLESFLSPVTLKKNEEKWPRRHLFPSSPKMEMATPYQQQLLDASCVCVDGNAQSPSAQSSNFKSTAASDRAQRDQEEPLGAPNVLADGDAQSPLDQWSSLKGTATSDEAQPDQQQPLGALSVLADWDARSRSAEPSTLNGMAADDEAQPDKQQPLGLSTVLADGDALSPSAQPSSLKGVATSGEVQRDQQQPLGALSVLADGDAWSPSAKPSSLKGVATGDEAQPDKQQPLGASSVLADGYARSPSAQTSSLKGVATGDEAHTDRTPYLGTVHCSPSMIDVSTQTEDFKETFGVTSTQTDAELEQSVPTGNGERDQELCSLRERLNLASQEAQSKTLLAMQLQTHLDSSSKQAELMEQALQNLEKKLAASRQECDDLKKEVTTVRGKLELAVEATKKEQGTSVQLKTEVQQLSVTVQHLQDALVELKKSGVPALKEDSPSIFGPRVHNV